MADVQINDLTNKATPLGSDEIELQATGGGASAKTTLANAVKGTSAGINSLTQKGTLDGTENVVLGSGERATTQQIADLGGGGGGGTPFMTFDALDGVPPAADFATLDNIINTADTPDSVISVLDFDPGITEEFTVFRGVMSPDYGGNGITAKIYWTSEATSGNVVWSLAFKGLGAGVNVVTKTFAAANDSAASATNGTARVINETTITFTDGADMDSVSAGQPFMLALNRSSAAGGDTMNLNDAEFHQLTLEET